MPVRRGAGVRWLSADEVHRLINDGMRSPKTPPVPREDVSRDLRQRARKRIEDMEAWQEWSDVPSYFLQAIPPPGTSLVTALLGRDGLRGALEEMDCIRPLGWNLRTDRHSEVRDGSLAYLWDPRRGIMIDPDGLLTVGATATSDYLGWARAEPGPNQPWVLHPLSLVEFTYEMTRFVHRELIPRSRGPWILLASCRRFAEGRGVALPAGRGEWYGRHDVRPATSNDWTQDYEASDDPAVDAFQLLVRVYALFGHDTSAIPFAQDGRISAEMIRAVD